MRRRLLFLVRWVSLSLLVPMVVLLFTNGCWYWHWQVRPGQDGIDVMSGRIAWAHFYTPGWAMPENGLDRRSGYRLAWWFAWQSAPNMWQLKVPIWLFAALAACVTAYTWRASGRIARWNRRFVVCRSCGYDRRGLTPDAKCPECGTLPTRVPGQESQEGRRAPFAPAEKEPPNLKG